MVLAEFAHGIAKRLPSDDGREIPIGFPVDGGLDPAFEIGGPAFVEPEMFPRGVAHEIPAPGMGELVGDDVDVLAVAADDGRGREGEDGVFHPAVREAGREDEHIVGRPGVVVDEGFSDLDESFRVGFELPFGSGELLGAGGDDAAGADGSSGDVAACEGEQVAGDRDVLFESIKRGT